MNILTWILRVLLVGQFAMMGFMKITTPYEKLLEMGWVENFTPLMIKGIGLVELIGAVGIILPLLLKIKPILSAYASAGLALTMVGAIITHLARGEMAMSLFPLVICLIAGFVAKRSYGEFKYVRKP